MADADGPYTVSEGSPVAFDASGSSDPDGDSLEYRWDFDNDGTWDTGWLSDPTAYYTWGDDWSGTVKVEVSDEKLIATATASVTVNNVAPTVDAGDDQVVCWGEAVSFSGTCTDPGASDLLYGPTAIWDFGDETVQHLD